MWTPDEDGYTTAPEKDGEPAADDSGAPERSRRARYGRDRSGARGDRSETQSDRSETQSDRSGRDGERKSEPARDPGQVARDICLQQLAVRPRTRAELAAVLRKRGVADQVAAEVLDRYDEVGLIDDAAFAKAWVASRHHGKGLARRALANELNKRGVDSELVGAALEEIDQDTEAATARALVDRKLRTMSTAPPEAVFRRLVGMLARKGYPPGLAITAVKEALAAREDEVGAVSDVVDPDDLPDLIGDSDDPIR
ncbi:regulatory protein RecX [Rugosimonospora africana]|uniref:regulatory protein RecX n=1 Tax=Rugosimonospora africana TaxID=556532 RepID=UPI003570AE88